jgi:hypothetical protein
MVIVTAAASAISSGVVRLCLLLLWIFWSLFGVRLDAPSSSSSSSSSGYCTTQGPTARGAVASSIVVVVVVVGTN